MKKIVVLCLLFLSACSLSGDQEQRLNQAVTNYIEYRNEGVVLPYVAAVHPNAVGYYKELGDSIFLERFTLDSEENLIYLQDGNLLSVEKNENDIQVKYSFVASSEILYINGTEEVFIYALSPNNGESWFFLDEKDYLNDEIIAAKERLINAN